MPDVRAAGTSCQRPGCPEGRFKKISELAGGDLSLFGHTDLAVHGAGRLVDDSLIARPAAAADRAPPTVKQPQPQTCLS